MKSAEKVETVSVGIKECTILELEKGNVKVCAEISKECFVSRSFKIQVKALDDEDDVMTISAGEGHLVHYLKPGMTVLVRLLDDRCAILLRCVSRF